jgi:hypothetical protein
MAKSRIICNIPRYYPKNPSYSSEVILLKLSVINYYNFPDESDLSFDLTIFFNFEKEYSIGLRHVKICRKNLNSYTNSL